MMNGLPPNNAPDLTTLLQQREQQMRLPAKAHLLKAKKPSDYLKEPGQLVKTAKLLHDSEKSIPDEQLGLFDDRFRFLGSLMIASLAFMGNKKKLLGLGEWLGLTGWFGAMTMTPKVIGRLVQLKTGLNLNQYYHDSNGSRRWLFQDPKYLPLHLLSEKEIAKIAKKTGIQQNTPETRRLVEEKVKQLTAQSLTWWMLVAGPLTPLVAGWFAHLTEGPAHAGLNQLAKQYHQLMMKRSNLSAEQMAHHQKALIEQFIGKTPNSDLTLWWQQFSEGLVKEMGLLKSNTPKTVLAKSDTELLTLLQEVMANPEHHTKLKQFMQQQEEKLSQLTSTLQSTAKQTLAPLAEAQVSESLASAKGTLAHYQQVLNSVEALADEALVNPSSKINRGLKALLSKPSVHEVERLILSGQHDVAEKLAGSPEVFKAVKGFISGGQYAKAAEALGASPAHHFLSALQSAAKKKLWRTRTAGWIGGSMLALSAIIYTAILGKGVNKKEALQNPQELKDSVAPVLRDKQRFEFQKLAAAKAALPPYPIPKGINPLKRLFTNNQAVVYMINPRTFGAKDHNGDRKISLMMGESGTFLSAINKLDELKRLGVNTIHLLPITPTGLIRQKGEAGSLYAPSAMEFLNPELDDPNNPMNVYQEARLFIQEAHKRGIYIMADVPSAASLDLAIRRADLTATDEKGRTLTPTNWSDIVMYENNPALAKYYQEFFDLMVQGVGVDGFRVDVARARPLWFWKHFIDQYPGLAWLAESYVQEDASPLENIPRDNPEELLKVGFDSLYGQLHIFPKMRNAAEYLDYLKSMEEKFNQYPRSPKSVIGSFLTHDDETTLIDQGGPAYSNLIAGLMAFQPFTNPYIVDGFSTGYTHKPDIFNYRKQPRGNHPEVATFMSRVMQLRRQYQDVVSHGTFEPVTLSGEYNNQIIAFKRVLNGKTLLIVANKDANSRHTADLQLAGLKNKAQMKPIIPSYGQPSLFDVQTPGTLNVSLGPARFHVFEL